jgi:transcriptional/translational regulatory protein YebC/TACO1
MTILERFEAKKQLRSKIYNILTLGYKDRERIREADKLVRQTISKCFRDVKDKIDYCIEIITKNLKVENLSELQKLAKQCDRISEEIEHTESGYAPHFTLTPVKKEQLKDFYNFDMKLLDDLTTLDSDVMQIISSVESGGDFEAIPKINNLNKKLNDIEAKLRKREDIVLKIIGE